MSPVSHIRTFDHVGITVADLDTVTAFFFGLVGGIGQYEDIWRMTYVRGPEGIIGALAQRFD